MQCMKLISNVLLKIKRMCNAIRHKSFYFSKKKGYETI